MATPVFKIETASDVLFMEAPTNGQVLQFDAASGNKWVGKSLTTGGLTVVKKTAGYTAAVNDHVMVSAGGANVTITLPASAASGSLVRVTKTDTTSNTVIVAPASGNLNGITTSGALTNTTSRTANYTASSLQNVLCNANGGGFTVTLPAPNSGSWLRVTKTDASSNGVLVVPPSGTIDGNASVVVNAPNQYINFQADGSAWHVIGETDARTNQPYTTQDFVSDGTTWWTI